MPTKTQNPDLTDQYAEPRPRQPSTTKTSSTKQDPDLADQARHSNPWSNTTTHPLRFKPLSNPSEPSEPSPATHPFQFKPLSNPLEPSPANPARQSTPIQTHHRLIPTHHHAQIKPRTQPSSDASLEREREMWDERKRDFAWSGRRRDRVGVRGREDWRRENWWNKKLIFSLELCHSAILKVELHCSSIAKKFAILEFSIPWCRAFWGLKCQISLIFGISIP